MNLSLCITTYMRYDLTIKSCAQVLNDPASMILLYLMTPLLTVHTNAWWNTLNRGRMCGY